MIISQTPFRVSFFGGGTDYTPYFTEHGGAVLSTTIDKYCYISVRDLPPFFTHAFRIAYSRLECVNSFDEIEHPSVRECLRYMDLPNMSLTYDGDLPARTGIGTSSSFTVGLLNALFAYKGIYKDKLSLGKEAIKLERDIIKENVGVQDQLAVACGGLNRMDFSAEELRVKPVVVHHNRKAVLNDNLMLFFTGISRFASEVAGEQLKTTKSKLSELRQMREMVDIGERILCSDGDLDDFGCLLHESWMLKRSLTSKISTDKIDDIYEKALKNGAIGGKLLGAGGGGFILFYVPNYKQDMLKKALGLLHVPFKFESKGSNIIYYD